MGGGWGSVGGNYITTGPLLPAYALRFSNLHVEATDCFSLWFHVHPHSPNTQGDCGVPERAVALESDRTRFESFRPVASLRTSSMTSQTQCVHL